MQTPLSLIYNKVYYKLTAMPNLPKKTSLSVFGEDNGGK